MITAADSPLSVPTPPDDVFEDCQTPAERDAVVRDWAAQQLKRYSPVVRTTGALRALPCKCMGGSLSWFDYQGGEWRCVKYGHAPRQGNDHAARRIAKRQAAKAAARGAPVEDERRAA